jgi:hypothetical protein
MSGVSSLILGGSLLFSLLLPQEMLPSLARLFKQFLSNPIGSASFLDLLYVLSCERPLSVKLNTGVLHWFVSAC